MGNKRTTRQTSDSRASSRSTPLLKPQRNTRKRNARRKPVMPLGERLATKTAALAEKFRSKPNAAQTPQKKLQKKPQDKPRAKKAVVREHRDALGFGNRTHHEVIGVLLWCTGALTLLSLLSYASSDASLNVANRGTVHNWIGPAGAFWADVLFQAMGIGAFLVGIGAVLAGWRAFAGRRVLPGLRESLGVIALMLSGGSFAHLLVTAGVAAGKFAYPPGGVIGALSGGVLLDYFAIVGGLIVSGALVLVSLALMADGVLTGLGLRGLGAIRDVLVAVYARWITHRARVQRRKERQENKRMQARAHIPSETASASLDEGGLDEEPDGIWSMGALPDVEAARAEQRRLLQIKIAEAKALGEALGDADAERESEEAKERALRDRFEPDLSIADTGAAQAIIEPRFTPVVVDDGAPGAGKVPLLVDATRPLDLRAEAAFADGPVTADPRVRQGDMKAVPPPLPKAREARGVERIDTSGPTSVPGALNRAVPAPQLSSAEEKKAPLDHRAQAANVNASSDERARNSPSAEASHSDSDIDIDIIDVRPDVDVDAIERAAEAQADRTNSSQQYQIPPTTLLDIQSVDRCEIDPAQLRQNAEHLIQTLKHYGIHGQVTEIRPGPVITMYEFVPAPGTKISKIANLSDDLAMTMKAVRVRIVAPIPGKGAVGIEIPNASYETVFLKELLTHDGYRSARLNLPIALGKDTEGKPYVVDMTKMPHLLVAGATGSGKSVSVNTIIMSILFNSDPEDVRLLMVDPKMLELSVYDGIPHLLLPVVTDPKKAAVALRWAVVEMERRYRLMSAAGVRNIAGYNQKVLAARESGTPLTLTVADKLGNGEVVQAEKLPYIVIIVDELADLMMVASREVEASIMRLAQMARAAGIHLILATQRPSVDVLTGVIKANFPTRIAFQVASKHDSRTILDGVGAEHLLGRGDMLYLSPGAGGVARVHGSFVSDEEIERSVAFIKAQGEPDYDESILEHAEEAVDVAADAEPMDEMYDQAIAIVTDSRQASISMIQRRLRIGYNRAARLVETMEREGIVGPADGARPREVLVAAPPG